MTASTTEIDYTGMTCIPPNDGTLRYVLKKEGKNTLFVIGLNTSTADENNYDTTVLNAMKIATAKGFDGFVMFNLYPLRATDPTELPPTDNQKLVDQNVAAIQTELANVANPTILAAWGTNIETREYLGECLRKIVQLPAAKSAEWKHFGELTKEGHPWHLSRIWTHVQGDAELSNFDVVKYIETLK